MPAKFVKASSWSLGPLCVSDPIMLTMSLDGLLPDCTPLTGIVGYNVFRRSVMQVCVCVCVMGVRGGGGCYSVFRWAVIQVCVQVGCRAEVCGEVMLLVVFS